ncbi:hypothetical protein [Bradyrhizobium sp. ORS 86]|uniref:hypothetical protein n=1 Tax=Bradyrhizobium sp. ORS 86 TaxID=1685970 RepID=UPI00388F83CB
MTGWNGFPGREFGCTVVLRQQFELTVEIAETRRAPGEQYDVRPDDRRKLEALKQSIFAQPDGHVVGVNFRKEGGRGRDVQLTRRAGQAPGEIAKQHHASKRKHRQPSRVLPDVGDVRRQTLDHSSDFRNHSRSVAHHTSGR